MTTKMPSDENSKINEIPLLVHDFMMPIDEAVAEIKHRRQNTELVKKVEDFLNNDIPEHFKNEPILYLARHVATPNFETLRFVELAKPYNLPIVIGEDLKDIFISRNPLKRSLAKMYIVKGMNKNNDEIIECATILDFKKNHGMKFKDIKTSFDKDLKEFHTDLFRSVYPDTVEIVDEADWIDRNNRGDLISHYIKYLSLLIVHGIMFEFYETGTADERDFVENILMPAYNFVKNHFGYAPLICNLVEPEMEFDRDWNSYPSIVYKLVKSALDQDTSSSD